MATAEQLQLDIITKFDGVGINQIRKQLMNMKKESQQLKQALTGVRKRFGDINATVNKDQVAEALKRARVEAKRFKGEYLSILFFGMAIQRVFGGFLTTAFQTFKKVTEGTSAANSQVGRLTAAWEFFKYSLINALLNNPMFQSFIEWLIGLVDWFSELNNKTNGWLAILFLIGAAVGGLLTSWGIIALGIGGIQTLFGPIIASTITWLSTTALGVTVMGAIKTALNAINTFMVAKMGGSWIGITLGWVAALLSVFFVAKGLNSKFGSWGSAFKAWAAAIALAVAYIFDSMVNVVKDSLDILVRGLQTVISGLSKAASLLGFRGLSERLGSAAKTLQGFRDTRIDIIGNVAQGLDKIGFNPSPTGSSNNTVVQNNEFNIGSADENNEELIQTIQRVQNESLSRAGYGEYAR